MIYKISIVMLLPLLFIAFGLSFAGVTSVGGDSYYLFLKDLSVRYSSWSFSIPNIPQVPSLRSSGINNSGGVIEVLRSIANFFVYIVNVFISVLNIFVLLINVLIHIIQFIVSFILCVKDFISRESVANLQVSSCMFI